ncbi:MAG: hypothetical protein HOB92_04495 [Candidatus Cloacimonetes bacterium]|jgi:hypothetical protein|nr:hypothetical protein [Candidatus Cloacimonadota bacterium]MBT4575707.1 hypothetical protein [Candidatus Cloacimonadota bacterium]
MKVKEFVIKKIERLPEGFVFTYEDIIEETNSKEAVIKNLNRMVTSGKLSKLSKGRFYKPEKTPFGKLEPNEFQIAKDLLKKNEKLVGYLTGLTVYNQLGLTTQISNIIQIGRNETRPATQRGKYKIYFIKQKNKISKENIPLLQILDAIRYIKEIPDTKIQLLCNRFLNILSELSQNNKTTLIRLALNYSPATRALLGALLDKVGDEELTGKLQNSLNPITNYKLGITRENLSTIEKWNLK